MKFFIFALLLLNYLKFAFGGGTSQCEPLHSNFLALLQACELCTERIVNRTIDFSSLYPGLASIFSADTTPKPNALISILAAGTNQLSGIDNSSILTAIIGTANRPLSSPLDCIENELSTFYPFVNSQFATALSALAANGRNSTINEYDTCPIVASYITPYYKGLNRMIHRILFDIFADMTTFKAIRQLRLYQEQFSFDETSVMQLLVNGIASLFNVDPTLLSEYLVDPFVDVPSTIYCRQELLVSAVSQAKLGYKLYSSRLTVPLGCDPFHADFIAFSNAWLNLVNDIQDFALDGTINNPVLTPSYALYVQCASTQALILAANATSRLFGVSSDTIYSVLLGTINPPFPASLDCVVDDLIYMRERVADMLQKFTTALNRFRERKSGSNLCSVIYAAFTPYYESYSHFLNNLSLTIGKNAHEFAAINMNDLFISYISVINNCLVNMLGTELAAIMNSNPVPVIAYLQNSTTVLYFPFSCIQIIILNMKNLLMQTQSSLLNGSVLNLTVVPLPPYTP